jgi:hypothetical protein
VAWVRERIIPTDSRLSAKLVPTSVDRWCHVVGVTDPYGRILGFLDRSRHFFFLQVAPQLYSRGWVDPVPDPQLLRKSGSAGNQTRTSLSLSLSLSLYIYIYIYILHGPAWKPDVFTNDTNSETVRFPCRTQYSKRPMNENVPQTRQLLDIKHYTPERLKWRFHMETGTSFGMCWAYAALTRTHNSLYSLLHIRGGLHGH